MQNLVALVPPPIRPVGSGTPEEWVKAESSLGTQLPEDYKSLIDTYGTGRFADWINIYSPFASKPSSNLIYVQNWFYDLYQEGLSIRPDDMPPFPAFPEPRGLLPWAGDDNGCIFCWATGGPPHNWVAVNLEADYRREDCRVLEVGAAEMLAGWFVGRQVGDWYPEDVKPTQQRYFVQSL